MTDAGGVARLAQAAGTAFPRITAAQALTARELDARRVRLTTLPADPDVAVVLIGSWGRHEVTSASDDDFLVVFEGEPRDGVIPSAEDVASALGGRAPGAEAMFAAQVSLEEMRGRIGRDLDSNTNLTRRMLIILESVAVLGDEVHRRVRRELLAAYRSSPAADYRPPRFLLNDLVRYWRTIAVDFESKMRERRGEGWGLRNAKLRLSRKALFAGGLLPVLDCHRLAADEMLDYLDERMSVPPLDRIADAFLDRGAVDPAVRALHAYDEFLGVLDDAAQREELDAVTVDDVRRSALFQHVADLGDEFEGGLLALLFDDPQLRRWVREYLIF